MQIKKFSNGRLGILKFMFQNFRDIVKTMFENFEKMHCALRMHIWFCSFVSISKADATVALSWAHSLGKINLVFNNVL